MSHVSRLERISTILVTSQDRRDNLSEEKTRDAWTNLLEEKMEETINTFTRFSQKCMNWDETSSSPSGDDRENFSRAFLVTYEFLRMLTARDLKILALTFEERGTLVKEFALLADRLKTGKF